MGAHESPVAPLPYLIDTALTVGTYGTKWIPPT